MRLYHFTDAASGLMIAFRGLEPRLNKYAIWKTMGVPVVWLTKEETNCATAEQVACLPADISRKVGDVMYGGDVRCIVEIERSEYVLPYVKFLSTTKIVEQNEVTGETITTGRDVLELLTRKRKMWNIKSWWISTRKISPSQIKVPLTRAQAIEACEWQVGQRHDAATRERWKQQRDRLAGSNVSAFLFENGKCRSLDTGAVDEL